jgi:hypothetical protein
MSIFLAFEALSDSAACVVAFCHLQIVPYDEPFGDEAIRLLSAVDLNDEWGKLIFIRPS